MHPHERSSGRAAHRLYCHFIWPTLGRIPLVSGTLVSVLERHIIVLCRRLDTQPVSVRAFPDRVHVLLRLKPGHAPSTLVRRLKSGSEAAAQASGHAVRWGRGYAAVSVSGSEVRAVMRRIHRLPDGPLPASAPSPRDPPASRRRPVRSGVDGPLRPR